MPGAYAHITMAFTASSFMGLNSLGISDEVVDALVSRQGYFELGAVSPDMPYLDVIEGEEAEVWADAMHLEGVAERIAVGVRRVAVLPFEEKMTALAWLLGFVGHVVFDVYMHPVVNIIAGGTYSNETKRRHRTCEMHQDVFIAKKILGMESFAAGSVLKTEIASLCANGSDDAIDPIIHDVWDAMLKASSPALYKFKKPEIDDWFNAFVDLMTSLEGLGRMARHFGANIGYPKPLAVERDFIHATTPVGNVVEYGELFEQAQKYVLLWWGKIARAICLNERFEAMEMCGWNLDTGKDITDKMIFWEEV